MTETEPEYKDWGPHMLQFSHQIPWQVVMPTVYRFMDPEYVQAFKDDGSLRLSSFAKFSKHSDEQRQDAGEGSGITTQTDGDMTMFSVTNFGSDAYALCGSISDAQSVSDVFGTTATLVITDTVQFAGAVARALPGCLGGIQGMCTYQDGKLFHKKTPPGEIKKKFEDSKLPEGGIDMNFITQTASATAIEQLFTKNIKYAHQLEYRWMWKCENVGEEIHIKVPQALEFCKFRGL